MVRSNRGRASVRRDSVGCNPRVGARGWRRGRRFGTPPQRTARRSGQWPASRQALPHNGAPSLAEPQSQQVGSARQDARHHAAVRSTSTCRSQPSSWFQLAKMRLTTSHPGNTDPISSDRGVTNMRQRHGFGCPAVAARRQNINESGPERCQAVKGWRAVRVS
jgi:hypothetical protein